MHWVKRDPETFEIILDLDTNEIKLQYLIVNNATGVLAGVENSNGTEATLYAYDEPGMFTNNTAVEFYPWFGAPPPSGGEGELLGTVTDRDTTLPIEGALISATAYQTGDVFTYTTDLNGNYTSSLCADNYDVEVEAAGYVPGEANVSIYPDEQTIQDFELSQVINPPSSVTLSGPSGGWVNTTYSFTATVGTITTTLPLTYTWRMDDQLPITHTGGLSDTWEFMWELPGTYAITVTASNPAGVVSDTHTIAVIEPLEKVYLPLVSKSGAPAKSLSPGILEDGILGGFIIFGIWGVWKRTRGQTS
jgi:hypothetical protein